MLKSRLNSSHSIDAAILYLRKKVFYSIHILYHTHIFNRLIESCTIQGIDFTDELTRGSQYKIENILLRINNSKDYSMICLNATESQVCFLSFLLSILARFAAFCRKHSSGNGALLESLQRSDDRDGLSVALSQRYDRLQHLLLDLLRKSK